MHKRKFVEGFGWVNVEVVPTPRTPVRRNYFAAKAQFPNVLR